MLRAGEFLLVHHRRPFLATPSIACSFEPRMRLHLLFSTTSSSGNVFATRAPILVVVVLFYLCSLAFEDALPDPWKDLHRMMMMSFIRVGP